MFLTELVPGAWRWENPLPTGVTLWGAWASAGDDVWTVGDGGTLLHFDGSAWSVVKSPVTASLAAVWGSGKTDVWAAGEQGTLLHYDGASWSRVASGTTAPLGVLSGTAADDVWVSSAAAQVRPEVTTGGAVSGATILHFDGRAWTQVSSTRRPLSCSRERALSPRYIRLAPGDSRTRGHQSAFTR